MTNWVKSLFGCEWKSQFATMPLENGRLLQRPACLYAPLTNVVPDVGHHEHEEVEGPGVPLGTWHTLRPPRTLLTQSAHRALRTDGTPPASAKLLPLSLAGSYELVGICGTKYYAAGIGVNHSQS